MPHLFRNRPFLHLFAGRLVTNAGDSLYFVATMWLVHDLTQTVVVAFGLGGAAWLISILVPWTAPSLVLFGIAWIPAGLSSVLFMSVLQRLVPSHLLGRVTSAVVSASSATMPAGSLLGGLLGDVWGSVPLLAASGAGFLGVGLYWLLHPSLRAFPALEAEMPEEYGFQTLGEGAVPPLDDGGR